MAEKSAKTDERVIEIAPKKALPAPADEPAKPRISALKTLGKLKPLLPILTGSLRMIDHGAVQALAQLLGLVSGGGGPQPAQIADELHQELSEIEATHRDLNRQVQDHTVALQRLEDQLALVRESAERQSKEQARLAADLRSLGNLVRFAGIGLAVLLIVLIALVVVLFLRHN